ncbi:MAG: polysaccharide deacetylase family protein [Candidatus Scalindua sp.]|jgi:peptidoglycan/xylan/chitin deacetylase (PgdA/CDA1 family)|nr:polysaccharide deacetylase family protein [Candidatus Scalindua sp.]
MGYLKNRAAVLQYQNICEDKANFLDTWVQDKYFEEQLEYFSKNSIPIISLCDVDAYIRGNLQVKKQSFSLTFDTGYVELYTLCYPLLKKYGYPATFFIRPDTIGKTEDVHGRSVQYMNGNQIRELEKSGISIGLYGCKGKWLSKTPLEEVRNEIIEAKALFKKELARPFIYYGVREGNPTAEMVDLFKEEGIKAVFCQAPTRRRTHPYTVGRIQIDDNDLNILLIKTRKSYVFMKDSRYWDFGRKCQLDKVIHFVSNTINRMKGTDIS